MKWSDIPFQPSPKILRQFAGLWLVFFLGLAVLEGLVRRHPRAGVVLGVLALVGGVLGLVKPAAIRWIFVGWMVVVFPIGWVVSQTMLAILYFGVFTPLALVFRLRGRDLLRLKRATGRSSYWLDKQSSQDVRSYFRQY